MATTADDDDDYDDAAADDDDVDDDGTPEVLMIKTIVSVFLTINKRLPRFLTLDFHKYTFKTYRNSFS